MLSKERKSVGIVMVMAMIIVGIVYNQGNDGEDKFYTERVFEEYNKDKGLKESEDYDYVYIDGDTRGIVYHEEGLELSIFPEAFMEGEDAIKEYEEVDKLIKQARS